MELFPLIRAGKGAEVRVLLEDDKGDHKRDVNVRNEKGQVRRPSHLFNPVHPLGYFFY
jgi:hypothetical protein